MHFVLASASSEARGLLRLLFLWQREVPAGSAVLAVLHSLRARRKTTGLALTGNRPEIGVQDSPISMIFSSEGGAT
jgi:hypothetical protein